MKVSELIIKLKELKEIHGDVDVYGYDGDGRVEEFDAERDVEYDAHKNRLVVY